VVDPQVSRGARKLEAAIAAFGLASRIAGKHALDVGAGAGGFTAVLLAHGARSVTAFDVGTAQLAQALRSDPRVRIHEQTDFRRAPLALAPGPFELFTVDVSFMAARNVLRALAFRLQPGAEGVVLLKPQFELPKSQVRGGDVADPNLRRRAFARFEARAHKLGFRVLAQRDSDVAGGSGTIEIPLHVRFEQRPASLPEPGTRRARGTPPAKGRARTATPETSSWFAVAAPGLERVLYDELHGLAHVKDARVVPGGVEFGGGQRAGYAVNLHSRVATRVLLRLGEVQAREFAQLRRRLARLGFEAFVPEGRPLRIGASARSCRLYHTRALAQTLQLAAGDRVGSALELASGDGETDDAPDGGQPFGQEPWSRLLLRGEGDRFMVSVDSSGLLLHRRGARAETGRAPLRETLAAGALRLAGYRGDETLVNAMCGAGTLALEAAEIALERAPGRLRRFAFESFPSFDRALWDELRAEAERAQRSEPRAAIHAFDRDPAAIELARRNAARAGSAAHLRFDCTDALAYAPPASAGLLIANPPYGKRLGRARDARALYIALGERLRASWRGFRVALLVPREIAPAQLGLQQARSFALSNGGIAVKLLVTRVP